MVAATPQTPSPTKSSLRAMKIASAAHATRRSTAASPRKTWKWSPQKFSIAADASFGAMRRRGWRGSDPADAKLMFVGEQPGDAEDLRGPALHRPSGGSCSIGRWRRRGWTARDLLRHQFGEALQARAARQAALAQNPQYRRGEGLPLVARQRAAPREAEGDRGAGVHGGGRGAGARGVGVEGARPGGDAGGRCTRLPHRASVLPAAHPATTPARRPPSPISCAILAAAQALVAA